MKINASHDVPSGSCGMGVAHEFREESPSREEYDYNRHRYVTIQNNMEGEGTLLKGTCGGTGYLSAGFVVGDEVCDEAFAQLAAKYKVVFITEARRNRNSGRMFYYAIFDCKGVRGAKIGFNAMDR